MTPATNALDAAGVSYTIHEYERDGQARDFGREAADRLGFDPDQVFKTLIATADGRHVAALVPVSGTLALKALGRVLGAKHVAMCDPAIAERITGYVRGGISPFGHKRAMPTVIDEIATAFDVVYVSGGRRGLDIGVAPADLVRLLDATVADIATAQ